ncbi:MAG: PadR family transcriptional regulator [Actinobacteria bacterium]|nr:MAG: PadR family transcriptional regulator [Actinomycetota bacterium]
MARERRPSRQTAAVLAALAAGPGWRHGYDLARETGLASGTLYPVLMRLEERGYLESRWSEGIEGRPRRHLYRITAAGLRYAAGAAGPARHRPATRPRLEGA